MAMFSQRARRIAWNHSNSGNCTSDFDSPSEVNPLKTGQTITRLAKTEHVDRFVEALERDGCVIVQDFTDAETINRVNEEVTPWMDEQKRKHISFTALGEKTRSMDSLIRRSPTARDKLFVDGLYQELCERFLAVQTTTWSGDKPSTNINHPLLSKAVTYEILPGTQPEALHRADKSHYAQHDLSDQYDLGRDMMLGLLVPGSDTTKSNCSIRVAPGTHLWGDERPNFGPDGSHGVVNAGMRKGDALITLGSLYYGKGAYNNASTSSGGHKSRPVHAMFSCSGVYRQEENPFLRYTEEDVHHYSKLVQQRLGWAENDVALGC